LTANVFLLSPAHCGGRRAALLRRPGSDMAQAARLRAGALTIGEAFAFLSGLYFRGKMAYAAAFAAPEAARVITPTRGLLPPSTIATVDVLEEFASVDVCEDNARYRSALERDAVELARSLPAGVRVVLLGSIATGKYVDVLQPIFGRLWYPSAFVGRGDMSRGGLLLRSAAAGVELEYAPIEPRVRPRGPRPPKLERQRAPA
jgi:hypothetical protein